jgi:hypothetical protein
MILYQGDNTFLCVGRVFHVYFNSVHKEATFTGILWAKELEYMKDGSPRPLRILNGDETRSGEFLMMPNDGPDHGGFPIAVTIPARTCIAQVQPYYIAESEEDR